jgi:hypothetical protein
MKRLVTTTMIKVGGEAVLLTVLAAIVIGIIGYLNRWSTSLQYSNAFFIAGSLLIIAGTSSRLAAGQERNFFQQIQAHSLREMSASEQANFIIQASSSVRVVILGLVSGILLCILSFFMTKLF